METKVRSATKSMVWRIMGVLILGGITFAYTGKWITTSLITFIHHGTFLIVFYVHERLWLKAPPMSYLKKSILKCITYETILGNVILGTITYLITGSWKTMGLITCTYIGFKHICYVVNEFVWRKKH